MKYSLPLERYSQHRLTQLLYPEGRVCTQYINVPRYIRSQNPSTCCLQKASVVLTVLSTCLFWVRLSTLCIIHTHTHMSFFTECFLQYKPRFIITHSSSSTFHCIFIVVFYFILFFSPPNQSYDTTEAIVIHYYIAGCM